MSLKATFEFILHLNSFRNIDLFQQGLYYLRFYLYHEVDNRFVYAQPYNLIECENLQNKDKQQQKQKNDHRLMVQRHQDNHSWAPAAIDDNINSYQTKTFMIRYFEEEVDLNEICFFKTEIEAYPNYDGQPFFLNCELMCADISTFGSASNGVDKEDEQSLFKCVSVFQARINRAYQGIHEYIPIQFDDQHFCLANATIHSILLDFKFRLSEFQMSIFDKALQQQQQNKSQYHPKQSSQKQNPILIQPRNLTEFINKVTHRFQVEEVEQFYNNYIQCLKDEYETLAAYILKIYQSNSSIKQEQFSEKAPQSQYQKKLTESQKENKSNSTITKVFDLKSIKDQDALSESIMQDINVISGQLYLLWKISIDILKNYSVDVQNPLKLSQQQKLKERLGESIFRNKVITNDLTVSDDIIAGKTHETIAEQMRAKNYYEILDDQNVEDVNLFQNPDEHPIVFEEVFVKQNNREINNSDTQSNAANQKLHKVNLFVLSHGFQGSSYDMRQLKNNLSLVFCDDLFLCAKSNEGMTNGDIFDMGRNLAIEVKQYINEWCPGKALGKINFIGHSLGGLIIRAALPHLEEFKDKMNTYMSLSSPHLGYMYNNNNLIDAGLWVLQQIKKSKCIQQLVMQDDQKIEDSFIYKLSQCKGFGWFKNIVFFSSQQDGYVPFESARIEKGKKNYGNLYKRNMYERMMENLLKDIKTDRVHRIDVNFKINGKSFDKMIGRAAHIQFLDNNILMKMLIYCFDHVYE